MLKITIRLKYHTGPARGTSKSVMDIMCFDMQQQLQPAVMVPMPFVNFMTQFYRKKSNIREYAEEKMYTIEFLGSANRALHRALILEALQFVQENLSEMQIDYTFEYHERDGPWFWTSEVCFWSFTLAFPFQHQKLRQYLDDVDNDDEETAMLL